ncbi:hypothetical protein ELQ35_17770 [Peribacillus cavernae]|uniref:Oxalate:formate antiporter n=1 Tax=Peribacillus cavernae TaxID=1674310 RepID=A0A433HFD3_9BACI|nr:hypothetical protein [Peribacillus cavernae]MDQ0221278.1 hypothetical protein [Peribacillus cavernae]RUQ26982.1 hypothetical protein ELQ35_17770 [Peribacillus cavernae]
MKSGIKDILYMHLQDSERFVISSGMNFREFAYSLQSPLANLLLLKHGYEDGEFNMNTLLEYISQENTVKLLKEEVHEYGDFCWIDFEEESGLDDLDGNEIAELLYIGHCKHHLKAPFYRKLNNQFVYLAHDDGWFNKVYYRSLDTYFALLGQLLPIKMEALRVERTWLGRKKRSEYPPVPVEIIHQLTRLITEGAVFSFNQVQQSRNKLEIPVWVVGDYVNMDDMAEGYNNSKQQSPNALIIFQRKTKEWSVTLNNPIV